MIYYKHRVYKKHAEIWVMCSAPSLTFHSWGSKETLKYNSLMEAPADKPLPLK